MKKYQYIINNLECANCAKAVEEYLNKETNLNNVLINFNTKKLSFESEKEYSIKELNKLIKKVEHDCYVTEKGEKTKKEYNLVVFLIGTILGICNVFIKFPYYGNLILGIISYILLLYRPFINGCIYLKNKHSVNENALIFISCVGAFIIGEFFEGLMVIVLYTIGKLLEEKAINKSRNSISDLINLKQDYANVLVNGKLHTVDVEKVQVGDILVVKKGEKIPVDGIVTKGSTHLDKSALTGESDLEKVDVNSEVLSGSINVSSVIEIKAMKLYENSNVSTILSLIDNATDKKSHTETTVSKISKYYTPAVLVLAIIVALILPLFNVSTLDSIYRALTFLVISCPCAIAISVPLAYFTGIGISSKKGILIKGSNYLDNLSKITKIVFDKTGTLTTGAFQVEDIIILDNKYSNDDLKELLIKGESLSNHPIAKSIIDYFKSKPESIGVTNFEEISGEGITFTYKKNRIKIGSSKLVNKKDNNLYVLVNDKNIAIIVINDGIKDNASSIISKLKKLKIKTYMFTGDKEEKAKIVSEKIGIEEVKSELLPQDKYHELENLIDDENIVAFVGDGINDAPVLKRADIGISMGSLGQESAIEASDIVIMNDDLEKIILGINISKYTRMIIKEDLIMAISIKILILILSVFGLTNMWWAVFADTGLTVIAILNTLRILKKFKK